LYQGGYSKAIFLGLERPYVGVSYSHNVLQWEFYMIISDVYLILVTLLTTNMLALDVLVKVAISLNFTLWENESSGFIYRMPSLEVDNSSLQNMLQSPTLQLGWE